MAVCAQLAPPSPVFEVSITARPIDCFVQLVGATRVDEVKRDAESMRALLGTRAVWNVSSTAYGGGVAEMLRSLLPYARSLGLHARWAVIEAPPEFFRVTKRLHNALHGWAGDGSALGPEEAALYDRVLHENALALDALLRPGDVVICHDPQTAGLVPHLMKMGALVVWRCHIGHENPCTECAPGWDFLRPYLRDAPFTVFSRLAYVPPWIHGRQAVVLPPTIDPFSAKNHPMDDATVRAIMVEVGLVTGTGGGDAVFVRDDGTQARVDRKAEVHSLGPPPSADTPLVVQVSRWDAMKDPIGVLHGFVRLVDPVAPRGAELVLAGPAAGSVADDPEAAQVFGDLERAWRALPDAQQRRVHLALLPMQDREENAAIVNALQRHAAVVVQKSLYEGFGLTVTEAMWKGRPVVASAVGGILDQIDDGVDGFLLRDPRDLDELAMVLGRVLGDEALARRAGEAAHQRVCRDYLSLSALTRWADLIRCLAAPSAAGAAA
jgi:trehalose synthase